MPLKFLIFASLFWWALDQAASAKVEVDANGPNAPLERQVLRLHGDPARPVTLHVNLVMPD